MFGCPMGHAPLHAVDALPLLKEHLFAQVIISLRELLFRLIAASSFFRLLASVLTFLHWQFCTT